jgi:hypothetical protein
MPHWLWQQTRCMLLRGSRRIFCQALQGRYQRITDRPAQPSRSAKVAATLRTWTPDRGGEGLLTGTEFHFATTIAFQRNDSGFEMR